MKNFIETLKEIEVLKQENKSKIRTVKLHILRDIIDNFKVSLDYKKGRINPGIEEIESFERDNLYSFFGTENLDEIKEKIQTLKKVLREAIEG